MGASMQKTVARSRKKIGKRYRKVKAKKLKRAHRKLMKK